MDNKDLISRQAAIDCCTFGRTSLGLIDELKRLPSAQPEQKKGQWIYDPELYPHGHGRYDCDQCGESVQNRTNFCPYCGARMVDADE